MLLRSSQAISTSTSGDGASNINNNGVLPPLGSKVRSASSSQSMRLPDISLSTDDRHNNDDWSVPPLHLGGNASTATRLPSKSEMSSSVPPGLAASRSLPNPSKLYTEVARLAARGQQLIVKEGYEADGVELLGKALWARTRFPVLQKEGDRLPWEHGEAFVVTCNRLSTRMVQSLREGAASCANRIMRHAEQALTSDDVDCFAGFHPLRQHLLGASLNTIAGLQRLNNEAPEVIVATLERALRVEGGRYSTATLFNLAAAYVHARRYDDACESVTRCIELADHYLSLPVQSSTEAWTVFEHDVATHACLGHLLLSSLGSWTGMDALALHHAKLATACGLMHLGDKNALTTRCVDRLDLLRKRFPSDSSTGLERGEDAADRLLHQQASDLQSSAALSSSSSSSNSEVPPLIPLQVPSLGTKRISPSHILPFALAVPLPMAVAEYVVRMQSKGDSAVLRGGSGAFLPLLSCPADADETRPGTGKPLSRESPDAWFNSTQSSTVDAQLSSESGQQRHLEHERNNQQQSSRFRNAVSGTIHQQRRELTPRGTSRRPMADTDRSTTQIAPPLFPKVLAGTPTRSSSTFQRSRYDFSTTVTSAVSTLRSGSMGSTSLNTHNGRVFQPKPPTPPTVSSSRNAPPPSKPSTAAVTSVLPKAHLQAYQQLQAEVQQQLLEMRGVQQRAAAPHGEQQSTLSSGTLPSKLVHRHDRNGLPNQQIIVLDVEQTLSAAEIMHQSDLKLRDLSVLRPDHTDADEIVWGRAATSIQRTFRGYRARKTLWHPRRQAVAKYIRDIPFAERIVKTWRDFLACRPAVKRKQALRKQRALDVAASVVQQCSRQRMSEYVLQEKWLASLRQRVALHRREQLRGVAAVFLQAWARGQRVLRRYRRMQRSARTIQRTVRWFFLYRIMKLLIFRRRIAKREFCALQEAKAIRIQQWYRYYMPQRRAIQELQRRKSVLEAHLADFWVRDRAYWASVSHLDDDVCRAMVVRWATGFQVRRKMYRLRRAAIESTRAARIVQRWYRFAHSKHSLDKRVLQYRHRIATRKRAEEVQEATIDIQRIARGMLGRRRADQRRQALEHRHHSAVVIQRAVRRVHRRKVYHNMVAARQAQAARYMLAQSRRFAALQIQSAWRMHMTKQFVAQLRQFLNVDRHVWARRVQRRIRFVLSSGVVERKRILHSGAQLLIRRAEERYVAARRIQSAARMMVTRKHLVEEAERRRQVADDDLPLVKASGDNAAVVSTPSVHRRVIFPTPLRKQLCATLIQCTWRRYAATMYVMQLRHARMYCAASRIHQEHLHSYVSVIQCAARRFILTPLRIAAARQEQRERAVLRIQHMARAFLDRRRALLLLLQQEEEEVLQLAKEEHYFAAMRIQKHLKGFLTKRWFHGVKRSVVVIQTVVRGFLARQQRKQRLLERSAQAARVVAQEEQDAARAIQRAWRDVHRKEDTTTTTSSGGEGGSSRNASMAGASAATSCV